MVEAVGSKPIVSPLGRVMAVERTKAVTPVQTAAAGETPTTGLAGAARAMAATAPVDLDRVATIRRAIASGDFPILPATIADRLLAFKLDWNPDEHQHNQA